MTTLKRGTIKSYSSSTHRASVQIAGSLAVWLDAVPMATDIPPVEAVAGRECAVLFFTDDNPDDAVVLTVHGAAPSAGPFHRLQDANNDTYVDAELNAGEDKVRIAVAGVLRTLVQTASPHLTLTGDVRLDGLFAFNRTHDPAQYFQLGAGAPTITADSYLLTLWADQLMGANNLNVSGLIVGSGPNLNGKTGCTYSALDFLEGVSGGGTWAALNWIRVGVNIAGTPVITTMRGLYIDRVAITSGVGSGTAYGIDIENLGTGNFAAATGIRVQGFQANPSTGLANGAEITRPIGGPTRYGLHVTGPGGGATRNLALYQDNATGYNVLLAPTTIGADADTLAGYALEVRNRLLFGVPNSAPGTNPGTSQASFYLDEATNTLKAIVKYSDGTTVKTATIALV